MNRKKIKAEAREILRQHKWEIIKPYLLLTLISLVISWTMSNNLASNYDVTFNFIINLLLYPISLGIISYVLIIIRKKDVNKKQIFKFYNNFILVSGLYV
ncbi:MAG: hypothetical protein PHG03_00905, partial [Bacilli bacterium]|nr:hypothetical protein [Bacilli bacterium]